MVHAGSMSGHLAEDTVGSEGVSVYPPPPPLHDAARRHGLHKPKQRTVFILARFNYPSETEILYYNMTHLKKPERYNIEDTNIALFGSDVRLVLVIFVPIALI